MYDIMNGANANDTAHTAGDRTPPGQYPELRLVKAELFKGTKSPYARCFKAVCEVLVDANGKKAGELVEFFEKLEFNKHESYDKEARASVLRFLGVLFGYESADAVNANVNGSTLGLVSDEKTQPMTGTVFSALVSYKKADSIFAKWSFGCVKNPDGTVKVVRGKGQQTPVAAPVAAPVQAPAPAAPPAPPPVTVTSSGPVLPIGWKLHPQDPRWMYNESDPKDMKQVG